MQKREKLVCECTAQGHLARPRGGIGVTRAGVGGVDNFDIRQTRDGAVGTVASLSITVPAPSLEVRNVQPCTPSSNPPMYEELSVADDNFSCSQPD